MNLYKPPHKHVGDKDKPGQIVVPVGTPLPAQHNEKPLKDLIKDFEEQPKLPEKLFWDIRK